MPRPLYPQGKSPWYLFDRRWEGPTAVLGAVVKRKIPSPRRESNPRTLIIPTELSRLLLLIVTCTIINSYLYCGMKF
jgi:hypothetical protein